MRSDFATVRLAFFLPSLRRDSLRAQRERRLVGRGGFEPPKALGRQIYSLLHLTALQPPRPLSDARLPLLPVELAEGFEPTTR